MGSRARWVCNLFGAFARRGRDEHVSATRDIGNEPIAFAAIAERFAQSGDVDPQGCLIDDGVWPSAGDELVLVDRFSGVFDQGNEDIECAAAETHRLATVEQRSLGRHKSKRPEYERLAVHLSPFGGGFLKKQLARVFLAGD
jgi:hypothetical protein